MRNTIKSEGPHKYKRHLGEINLIWETRSKIHIYDFDKNREGCLCCDFYFDFIENNFYTMYPDQGFLSPPPHSFNSMPSVSFFLENT